MKIQKVWKGQQGQKSQKPTKPKRLPKAKESTKVKDEIFQIITWSQNNAKD